MQILGQLEGNIVNLVIPSTRNNPPPLLKCEIGEVVQCRFDIFPLDVSCKYNILVYMELKSLTWC